MFFDKSQIKILPLDVKLTFSKVFTNLKNPNVCRRPWALTYPSLPHPQTPTTLTNIQKSTKTNKKIIRDKFFFPVIKTLIETSAHKFFEQTWK